ncbi:hypothetical protein J7U46_17570 [Pelomonas sp. V22]|uniref:hypothetical protein n=1 Tax=Pelomonas sp. V22 TaxID=2822139 RepID=UPI0024A889BF|nr:hypothetical protein [Pelomonas sp. V22]MDI4634875.1 hypothetical protein [Pelomonas sp. V22]
MLRALLVLLLLANAAFFSWTQGWLDGVTGVRASGEREPERLQKAKTPERISLLNPQAAAALQLTACIEIGPVKGEAALQQVQSSLERAGIAPGSYELKADDAQAGQWGVVTIKLTSKDFRERKEETYKRLKVPYEPLPGMPEEQPSLLLSRHASEKAAEAALEAFSQRALKGLRVLQLQKAEASHKLRFEAADGALQAQLRTLAAREFGGPGLTSCVASAGVAAASAASVASAASR